MSEKSTKKTGQGKGTANAKGKLRQDASRKRNADAKAKVPAQREKVAPGRKSEYDPAVAAEFCRRISLGHTVRSVTQDDDMPVASTIYRWLEANPEFNKMYGIAKELHCDAIFDQMLEIAGDTGNDTIYNSKDQAIPNNEWINRSRLKIDVLKFRLAKLMPKKYGEKVETTVVSDPEQPFRVTIDVKSMKVEELKGFIRDHTHGRKQ